MTEKDFWGPNHQFSRSPSIALGENMDNGQPDECDDKAERALGEMRMEGEGGAMMPTQPKLPDTNPKTQYGIKKPALLSCVPASALLVEGQVMMLGARKYGPFNWRDNSVAASVYVDAAIRHMLAWNSGQDNDSESGVSHLGHVRACMGILIDALETGNLVDDRPKDEATARLLDNFSKKD